MPIRRWFIKYHLTVQFFLFVIGVLILFLPILLNLNFEWNLVCASIATSMMASLLLSLLEHLMGTDIPTIMEQRLDFNRQVYDIGLQAVHLYADESIFEKFVNAHSIDLMTATAKGTFQQYGRRIISAIELHGCKVRVLIADPNSLIWGNKDISNALCPGTNIPGEIRDTIDYIEQAISELNKSKSIKAGSIEVRVYSCVPTSGIIIVNNSFVRHTPYLPSRHSIESPTFDLVRERGGQLFNTYSETFDWVWEYSQQVLKEDWFPPRTSIRSAVV